MSTEQPQQAPTPDALTKELAELKAQLAALTKQKEPEQDLLQKAELDKKKKEDESNNAKALEQAIKFGYESQKFVSENKTLLPKDFEQILETANKQNYDNAIQKDQAIKSAMIESFFKIQSNLDLLTGSQKNYLEEYLKLTKNGKEQKSSEVYAMVFEPAFETLKRVKRTEMIKNGFNADDDSESYKNKLIKLSRKHYLGV
jgi:hypothetical protein